MRQDLAQKVLPVSQYHSHVVVTSATIHLLKGVRQEDPSVVRS